MTTLAELKAEAAQLSARIAELEGNNDRATPPPQVVERREVSITAVNAERVSGMPDLKQVQRLFNVVRPLSPWPQALNDRFDEHRPFRSFSSSFRWVMNMPRTERPNGKVALSYWIDVCRTWLRVRNSVASDVDTNGLVLACFAAGDVRYTPANGSLGHTWEIGLIEFGGRPADMDAWRKVLETGAILPPSAPSRRTPALSNVRITVGY